MASVQYTDKFYLVSQNLLQFAIILLVPGHLLPESRGVPPLPQKNSLQRNNEAAMKGDISTESAHNSID